MNISLINNKLNLLESILQEKGNNVSYSYHSTQINLEDCLSEKDYGFYRTRDLVPEDYVYREFPQVKKEVLGGSYLKDDPNEEYGLEKCPHVTVLYGLTKEYDYFKMRNALKKLGPVKFKIGDISSFRNPDTEYDVLKLSIISPKLEKLHYWLRKKFDNENKFPEYKPHLTLAYIKKGTCKDLEGPCKWTGKVYTSNGMKFSHKDSYLLDIPFGD